MTPTMAAVRLDAVSVRYRVPQARTNSLRSDAIQRLQGAPGYLDFEALRDVSLEVAAGEALGVVGPNGSGKTTLLRLIARVLTPTSGRVRTAGRVAPILDIVGALHPELTGRENIVLNGTVLGLNRRQIADRLDGIVEFAEVGAFIDAPLRTYSNGMVARLGFAVASAAEADILVVDEALGAGDERFSASARRGSTPSARAARPSSWSRTTCIAFCACAPARCGSSAAACARSVRRLMSSRHSERRNSMTGAQTDWRRACATAAVCLTVDDVHPTNADGPSRVGDVAREALGHLEWLLARHPLLKATLFVLPTGGRSGSIPHGRGCSAFPGCATGPTPRRCFLAAPCVSTGIRNSARTCAVCRASTSLCMACIT